MQVIESVVLRGDGTNEDVYREVTQYHTLDGELLAERDPYPWMLPRRSVSEG